MSLIGKIVVLGIVWLMALAEPTPFGEGAAVAITLGMLGVDDEAEGEA